MIGMNSKMMCQYIEFVAEPFAGSLGYPKLIIPQNIWLYELIPSRKNRIFFEESEWNKKQGVWTVEGKNVFTMDEDFWRKYIVWSIKYKEVSIGINEIYVRW